MTASFNGTDVVQTLIEAKAQINTQKEDGWTALHLAANQIGDQRVGEATCNIPLTSATSKIIFTC